MTSFPSNTSLETYHYDSQIRNYIIQFMAVFAGLQVSVGENDFVKQSKLITVPIRYGSVDRVVAAIKSDNTTNKPIRLPTLAAYLNGIQMAPEARKGVSMVERYTRLHRGGAFPTDLHVIQKEMPIPYLAIFNLSIMTSNSNHHYQILEQILTLFNPIIQIQTSDDADDWKRITTVELTDIGLEENYPAGGDNRIIQTTLTFLVPINLSPPTVINKNYIAEIKLRLAAISTFDNTNDVVSDVTRTFPEYETLISAKDLNFPQPD
jgi:hypothetical protein